ncbi:MAG TPA: ABC transporter permease [Acidimicrobiales bacterium]|nr:ABC transporter permease [Acidimicrobiales bacterium]
MRAGAGWLARRGSSGGAVWIIVLAVVVVLMVGHGSAFLAPQNLAALLSASVVLGLVSIGEMIVILTAGIDLSVGSLASLTCVLAAGLIAGRSALAIPILLLILALGAAIGVFHGFLVTKLRLAPFIVTLSTYFILEGVGFGYTTVPIGSMPAWVTNFYFSQIGPVPWIFVILLAIGLGLGLVLSRSRYGRHLYAVGGDRVVARSAGINVTRVIILAYVISGILAAFAGYLLAAQAGTGVPSSGSGLELSAIAAVVVGGTSLAGGRGHLIGMAGGVALLSLVQNAFQVLAISGFYQGVVRGVVILAAVAIFSQKD